MSTKKKNLDLYLAEVFKQFIAIKDDDYKKSQEVFKGVFDQVKQKMGEQCNYFGKYSSQVMYAGSVYDGIKVSKLDEFDMDIVIRLPINYDEDIIIENDQPGFVKLKIDGAFDLLDKQQDWEKCHRATRDWRDTDKYLLQNKFRHWMHGIVQKALNEMNGQVKVNDVNYLVKYKESGPAYTLNIENDINNEEFKLDVDLVPVIRFQYPRWPEGYRNVNEGIVKDWLIVPKPNKGIPDGKMKNRCWRLSFQDFERDMMKGCQQLKTTIRLVKKLRDSLQMNAIASYYIKTLFLWKIDETKEKKYWQKPLTLLFRTMVGELHEALKNKTIPYFWQKDNNLIATLKPTIQKLYAEKLKNVLDCIEANDADKLVAFLLVTDELQEFKKSEFYERLSSVTLTPQISRQEAIVSVANSSDSQKMKKEKENPIMDILKSIAVQINAIPAKRGSDEIDIMKSINDKMTTLTAKVDKQNQKLENLECGLKMEREKLNDKIDALLDKIEAQNDRLKALEMSNNKLFNDRAMSLLTTDTSALQIGHNEIRLTKADNSSEGEMFNLVSQ